MSDMSTVPTKAASIKPKSTDENKTASKTKSEPTTKPKTNLAKPNFKPKSKTSATGKKDQKKEDEKQRMADMEKKIRRRIGLEEKAFKIIEQLLDNPVEKEFLLDVAKYILPSHFSDVIEERSIIHQCGYPICSNMLKNVPKQKYHISLKSNQVYDISERKMFCSNQCFKAAKYFKEQLSAIPVWLREGESVGPFHLLQREANRGYAGDVLFEVPGQEIAAELRLIGKLDHLSLHDSDSCDDKAARKPQTKQPCSQTSTKDSVGDDSLQDDSQNIQKSAHATLGGISLAPAIDLVEAASLVAADSSVAPHGQDVVVLSKTSFGGQTDVTTVLPKTDMSTPSCNIVHDTVPVEAYPEKNETEKMRSLDATPVEAKMNVEQKTKALMQMLDRRDELQTELAQHHKSVEDGKGAESVSRVVSSSQRQDTGVRELTDSKTSQEDVSGQDNSVGVSLVEPSQMSRNKDKQQAPVSVGAAELKEEEMVKSNTGINTGVVSKSAIFTTNSNAVSERSCVSSSQALANIQKLRQMQSHKGSRPKAKEPGSHMATIWHAIQEWKTSATVTFLSGTDTDKDSDDDDEDTVVPQTMVAEGRLPTVPPLQGEEKLFQMKVCDFYKGVYPADTSDIASSCKKKNVEETEVVLPPVDSHSQMALRRKIVLDKLTKVLPLHLSPMKLSLSGIVAEIRQLVHTFRLTSENILFRPAEWTLLGLILLKVLSVKMEYLRTVFAHTYTVYYFRSFVLSMNINETDVQEVVDFLRSAPKR